MQVYWQARTIAQGLIREFFAARGYLELDTPAVVVCPGSEVHLRYFPTTWLKRGGEKVPLYLRSSPEIHLKKAVAAGCHKVFELARCYRSGGENAEWHHPEFTMLEWYEKDLSFEGMIELTEELVITVWQQLAKRLAQVPGAPSVQPVPAKKCQRFSIFSLFEDWVGITLQDGDPDLVGKARSAGVVSVRADDDFETAFFKILLEKIEPRLRDEQWCVVYDYPPSQAALAQVVQGRAKRFEFYLNGIELCNGFLELLNPQENKRRFAEALKRRREMGYECPADDPAFYESLKKGLPPCSGNALGFDRLLALMLGEKDLKRVIPFSAGSPFWE